MKTIYLRIKIKSLAAEARIIRREEHLAKQSGRRDLLTSLHLHRVLKVRQASRYALLAYAFLRRRPYLAVERTTRRRVCAATLTAEIKRFAIDAPDEKIVREWLECEQAVKTAA